MDAGLQPERTLLAWRRTALALAVIGAVGIRMAVDDLGVTAVVVGAGAVIVAAVSYVSATRRYRTTHEEMAADGTPPGMGGPALLMVAAVASIGLLGLGFVVMTGIAR